MNAAASRLRLGPLQRRPIDMHADEERVRVLEGLGLGPGMDACALSGVPQPR
jgi:hypothetical protein